MISGDRLTESDINGCKLQLKLKSGSISLYREHVLTVIDWSACGLHPAHELVLKLVCIGLQ